MPFFVRKRKIIVVTLVVLFLYLYSSSYFKNTTVKIHEDAFVILSSSLKPRYLFLLPFTVASWQRINISAIVFLIGAQTDFEKNKQAMTTINLLKEMNAEIIFLESKKLSSVSLSQIVRLFPSAIPFANKYDPEKTIFVTSDADLFVFHLKNHIPDFRLNKTLHLYNSQCCRPVNVPPNRGDKRIHMFPMGTIGATIKTWQNIMGFNNSDFTTDEIENYVIEEFGPNFFHYNDTNIPKLIGSTIWSADQSLISFKLDLWFKNSSNTQLLSELTQAPRRIDRIKWPKIAQFKSMKIKDWDDCHLPTAAFEEEEWHKFMPFLEFAFKDNPNLMKKMLKYRDEFVTI